MTEDIRDIIAADARWADVAPLIIDLVSAGPDERDPQDLFYLLHSLGECYYDEHPVGTNLRYYEAAALLRLDGDESASYVDEWYADVARLLPIAEPQARLVNLTPHPVTVYSDDDQIIVTVPSDGSLRLTETAALGTSLGNIPTTLVSLGEADGMPPVVEGTTYIVSMPLLMGLAAAGIDRPDMVYPYGQVRDGQGRIVGCRSLARIAR